MKKIKRIILVILLLMFMPQVMGQENKLNFNEMKFSETENPITYKYFQDYADTLRGKIDFARYFRYWTIGYRFVLHKDGVITNIKYLPFTNVCYRNTDVANHVNEIFLKNTPPPYPEGMEIDDVCVELHITPWNKDATKIYYSENSKNYIRNTVTIYIRGKSRHIIW